MNKFQSLFLGATMAATTMTAVAFAPSSASAITLDGNLTVGSGASFVFSNNDVNPNTITINWANNTGTSVQVAEDSFASLRNLTANQVTNAFLVNNFGAPDYQFNANSVLSINQLVLNYSSLGSNANLAIYNYGNVTSFLQFDNVTLTDAITSTAQNGTLHFDLASGQIVKEQKLDGNFDLNSVGNIFGTFRFVGSTAAIGTFTANGNLGKLSANSLTVQGGGTITVGTVTPSEPVPEPLTMGGLAIGAGFGAFLKKRYAKKEKQLAKA